ncbi:NeuD/PglB/VioB family sugar acetyltransferase [Cytophagaceae bacterium ABcell3]|nr:NeuD/PglB/VioB family sugar acetyltransferase [Cytophagaceae bacterium ABcell3]
MGKSTVIVGYSGHAFVILDALATNGVKVQAYVDIEEKQKNPYNLKYIGKERDHINFLRENEAFVSVGENDVRARICQFLLDSQVHLINVVHSRANVSESITIGKNVFISGGANVNSQAYLADGVIVNTGAVVEHECYIEEYAHVAPGAVLAGNVSVGAKSFVGANCVVRQGVKIGKNVVIGAGTVVVDDVPDGLVVVGNPQKVLYGK